MSNGGPVQWEIHAGYDAFLSYRPQLIQLADRCGLVGAMDYVEYLLTTPYHVDKQPRRLIEHSEVFGFRREARGKLPHLLLRFVSENLTAAILLHEYRLFGLPTQAFISVDADGYRTVIAPPEQHAKLASEAAEFLLSRGAAIVLVSIRSPGPRATPEALQQTAGPILPEASEHLVAAQVRGVARVLPLEPTFDGTIGRMGKRTRRNLRNSLRQVVKEFSAQYIPECDLSKAEFMEMNRRCAYPVQDWVAEWRYDSSHAVEGGIFAGMRARDGRWLSVIGGRRHHHTTYVDWQMNLAGSTSISIVTAARAFFLEDAVGRGMQWMRFEGGTGHTMASAFIQEEVYDLVFARRILSPGILKRLGRWLPATGMLAETFTSDALVWLRD